MNPMIINFCSCNSSSDLLHTPLMFDRWCFAFLQCLSSLLSLMNAVSPESFLNLLSFSSSTVTHDLPCVLLSLSLYVCACVCVLPCACFYLITGFLCWIVDFLLTDDTVKTSNPALSKNPLIFIDQSVTCDVCMHPCVCVCVCISVYIIYIHLLFFTLLIIKTCTVSSWFRDTVKKYFCPELKC